jgi:hypothetical protein
MKAPEPVPFLADPSGEEHFLSSQSITIGRAVENDIVIVSKRVSRQHACIWREGMYWLIEDMESTNGTYLNNERLLESTRLRDGDRIMVGDITFVFHDPDTTIRDKPFPELDINLEAGEVRVDRNLVSLSPKEFALLAYLYNNQGKVCSKDDIGSAVWSEYHEGVYDYQIENLVRRLRAKIEIDPANPQLLLTMRGLGYKLIRII